MKTYQINKNVKTDGIKTAQVLALVSILTAMEVQSATSEQISAHLKSPAGTVLKTRQDPMLIFRYYIRELKTIGVLTEIGDTPAKTRTITIDEPTNVLDAAGNMW